MDTHSQITSLEGQTDASDQASAHRRLQPGLRRFMAIVSVVAMALSLLFVSSYVLFPKNNQSAFGMRHQEAHGILGEPENSIDVLFVGDSETTSSISPLQIWKEQGFTSYVCASNGQKMPYGLSLLDCALDEQSPKVVAIEANSIYASFSLKECAHRFLQDLFPVFEYHDRWKTVTPNDFIAIPVSTWTDPFKGFYVNEAKKPADAGSHMEPTHEAERLPALNKHYLRLFVERCREAGATPVIIATPSTICWNSKRHNGMAEAAEELGVDFVDLNDGPSRVDIDWNVDTRDAGDHLNYQGAVKVSCAVGRILKDSYGLRDRRDDPAFGSWNESLAIYEQSVPKECVGN